jgi:hypothetical protein
MSQIGKIEDTVVCRAVTADGPRPVEGKHYRKILQAYVVENLVISLCRKVE